MKFKLKFHLKFNVIHFTLNGIRNLENKFLIHQSSSNRDVKNLKIQIYTPQKVYKINMPRVQNVNTVIHLIIGSCYETDKKNEENMWSLMKHHKLRNRRRRRRRAIMAENIQRFVICAREVVGESENAMELTSKGKIPKEKERGPKYIRMFESTWIKLYFGPNKTYPWYMLRQ